MRAKNITAEIIADSLAPTGERLTSFIVTIPRIVLAEFNTHRMLSRNSASSRAIPFKSKIESMFEGANASLFIPIGWQKDHKGMQGDEYFTGDALDELDAKWVELGNVLKDYAQWFSDRNVTKQICNRILELHSYQTIIVTASEWQNFLALRAHGAAEIHIQDLAFKMLDVYNESTPKQLKKGEWHIPFGDQMDTSRIIDVANKLYTYDGTRDLWCTKKGFIKEEYMISNQDIKVKIATARCARVSYQNYEGGDDYEKDIKLHDRLSGMGHWSPFEHCAKGMISHELESINGDGWSGNFKGFIQYRKMFTGENKSDNRVSLKN